MTNALQIADTVQRRPPKEAVHRTIRKTLTAYTKIKRHVVDASPDSAVWIMCCKAGKTCPLIRKVPALPGPDSPQVQNEKRRDT